MAKGSNVAMTIIVLGIMLFVGAIVFGRLEPTMLGLRVTGMSATANSTIASVATNVWSGYGLAIIAVVIVGAVVILGYARMLQ